MYPLVRELTADGIPVAATCRVLKLHRVHCCRWLACPVGDRELTSAWMANAVFDAHRDDPEFGYRILADEVRSGGHTIADETVWRHCRANGWHSTTVRKTRNAKAAKPTMPAHGDRVCRQFTAAAPNVLWLTDLTEHRTDEGKLYLCAIQDG
jgi:transposase InsO family protein